MALKDWKRTKISISSMKNYGWKWKKGAETIRLYTNATKTMPNQKRYKYSYSLWFDTKDKDGQITFMTKPKAISFARNYMKQH